MSYGGGTPPAWARGTHGWHVGKEDAREHFALALESGINFFDTADVYSIGLSEEITGAHLGEMASRDDIVLATKVHGPMGPGPNRRGFSRKHIIEACENSLRRLGMDYVDLCQIHRWDEKTPIEETLDALDSLVQAGKGSLSRRQQHGRLAALQSSLQGPRARMAPLRQHAKPLQPDLPRRGARNDSAVHRSGSGGHSVEPAGSRLSDGQPRTWRRNHIARAQRHLRPRHVFRRGRFRRRRGRS
jgi:hypothetical protein